MIRITTKKRIENEILFFECQTVSMDRIEKIARIYRAVRNKINETGLENWTSKKTKKNGNKISWYINDKPQSSERVLIKLLTLIYLYVFRWNQYIIILNLLQYLNFLKTSQNIYFFCIFCQFSGAVVTEFSIVAKGAYQ